MKIFADALFIASLLMPAWQAPANAHTQPGSAKDDMLQPKLIYQDATMTQDSPFKVLKAQELPDILGLSSLAISAQGLYALADNQPLLYRLDCENFGVCDKILLDLSLDPEVAEAEIPKALKPDFEASALIEHQGQQELLLFGSGSLKSVREKLLRVNLQSQQLSLVSLSELYASVAQQVIEVNIEGASLVQNHWLLANRGHQGQPLNHLLWIQDLNLLQLQTLHLPQAPFVGVSGLEYQPELDRLWFCASTEATGSVYEDGEIGDSYLGWIENFSRKRHFSDLEPDFLLNLSQLDQRFKGQKIEAIAIEGSRIYLGSDNDGLPAKIFVLQT